MLQAAIRILTVVTLVEAFVVFNSGSNAFQNDTDRNLSSGSDEAEIFLTRDKHGQSVVSKKYYQESPGKKMYVIKRLKPNPRSVATPKWVAPVTTRKKSKLLNRISNFQELKWSSEEMGLETPPLKITMAGSGERYFEQPSKPKSAVDSTSDQMEIAQKWFPILLRRAVESMLQNNTRQDLDDLVEKLTLQTWKADAVIDSEKNVNKGLIQVPEDVHSETNSVKQKRADNFNNQSQIGLNRPCVINIFNNSHIGCLVLGSANNECNCSEVFSRQICGDLSLDEVLTKSLNLSSLCSNPQQSRQPCGTLNLKVLPNCVQTTATPATKKRTTTAATDFFVEYRDIVEDTTFSPPAVTTPCPKPTITVPTTVCQQTTSSTAAPVPCLTTPAPLYQPSYCPHHPPYRSARPTRTRFSTYPWYNHPELDYRPQKPCHTAEDPYRNLPYDLQSEEIVDCSPELEYRTNYHMKREPNVNRNSRQYKSQSSRPTPTRVKPYNDESVRLIIDLPASYQKEVRKDAKLRDTLAKIGLSLNTESPARTKPTQLVSRYTGTQPVRTHGTPPYSKLYNTVTSPLRRTTRDTVATTSLMYSYNNYNKV